MIFTMRFIPQFEDYKITAEGAVWSIRDFWLKPYTDSTGYLVVDLRKNGKKFQKRIHRLIGVTFILNPENKPNVCHKNGNRLDNRVENLYWGNARDNMHDAIRRGTFTFAKSKGEKHKDAKLKQSDIVLIRKLLANSHITLRRIGELFGVHTATISDIKQGRSWIHV